MKFRALRIHQEQAQIVARYETMTVDELTAGEVVIRVQYSSINYKDALAATGAGKILRHYPLNGGVDLAGVVERSEDSRYAPDQTVLVTGCGLSETLDGGYAEYARVPSAAVIPIPVGFDALDVMTIGTAGFTAALAIHRMEHNGQTPEQGPIAVTGATGGVGSLAIDMLVARGYQVIAVTGKADQREYLHRLGAQQVWLRQDLVLGDAALEAVKFAGAIDNVGGAWLSWLIRSLQPRGNVTSIGLTAGSELHTSVMPFLLRGVNVLGINSTAAPRELREQVWQRIASDLKPRRLELIRQRIIGFDELLQVFPDYLQAQVHGRTVVRIQD
jgi:acrylyl-CoA reductase (NADPH)